MSFRLVHGEPCPHCHGPAIDDDAIIRIRHELGCPWRAFRERLVKRAKLVALALAAEQGKTTP